MNTSFKFFGTSVALCMGFAATVQAQNITGAGASFPAPLYAKWAADYKAATGVQVNYQSVGSGAGLQQIKAKTVDFGASDMPLKDADLKAAGLVQFPTVIGGVVPVINIKGISPGQLKLSGPVLASIYLGKIILWNDPAIAALNPGVPLPNAKITIVRRADGSGTSFVFTNYLSKVSPEWKSKVGEGTAVNWPAGTGGKGNEGVAQFVSRIPNSIGYVEYAYVKQNKMNYAQMHNAAGKVVSPSEEAFKASAATANWKNSFYQILTNQQGDQAWPISAATFILMQASQDKPEKAAGTLKFFKWAMLNADKQANALAYVPLPKEVKDAVEASWKQIKDPSGKAIAYK